MSPVPIRDSRRPATLLASLVFLPAAALARRGALTLDRPRCFGPPGGPRLFGRRFACESRRGAVADPDRDLGPPRTPRCLLEPRFDTSAPPDPRAPRGSSSDGRPSWRRPPWRSLAAADTGAGIKLARGGRRPRFLPRAPPTTPPTTPRRPEPAFPSLPGLTGRGSIVARRNGTGSPTDSLTRHGKPRVLRGV